MALLRVELTGILVSENNNEPGSERPRSGEEITVNCDQENPTFV